MKKNTTSPADLLYKELRREENKKCFDCPSRSPQNVNITARTFVCTRCSGLLREYGQRIKSISASVFSSEEVRAMQEGGNAVASTIFLATYSPQYYSEPKEDDQFGIKDFMRLKYGEMKWYRAPGGGGGGGGGGSSSSPLLTVSSKSSSLTSGMNNLLLDDFDLNPTTTTTVTVKQQSQQPVSFDPLMAMAFPTSNNDTNGSAGAGGANLFNLLDDPLSVSSSSTSSKRGNNMFQFSPASNLPSLGGGSFKTSSNTSSAARKPDVNLLGDLFGSSSSSPSSFSTPQPLQQQQPIMDLFSSQNKPLSTIAVSSSIPNIFGSGIIPGSGRSSATSKFPPAPVSSTSTTSSSSFSPSIPYIQPAPAQSVDGGDPYAALRVAINDDSPTTMSSSTAAASTSTTNTAGISSSSAFSPISTIPLSTSFSPLATTFNYPPTGSSSTTTITSAAKASSSSSFPAASFLEFASTWGDDAGSVPTTSTASSVAATSLTTKSISRPSFPVMDSPNSFVVSLPPVSKGAPVVSFNADFGGGGGAAPAATSSPPAFTSPTFTSFPTTPTSSSITGATNPMTSSIKYDESIGFSAFSDPPPRPPTTSVTTKTTHPTISNTLTSFGGSGFGGGFGGDAFSNGFASSSTSTVVKATPVVATTSFTTTTSTSSSSAESLTSNLFTNIPNMSSGFGSLDKSPVVVDGGFDAFSSSSANALFSGTSMTSATNPAITTSATSIANTNAGGGSGGGGGNSMISPPPMSFGVFDMGGGSTWGSSSSPSTGGEGTVSSSSLSDLPPPKSLSLLTSTSDSVPPVAVLPVISASVTTPSPDLPSIQPPINFSVDDNPWA